MANRWSPTEKHADVALSGDDLIARNSTSAPGRGVRSIAPVTTGKVYCELVVNNFGATPDVFFYMRVGVANETFVSATELLGDSGTDSWALLPDGSVKRFNGGSVASGIPECNDGDVIHIAVDMATKKVWFGRNNTFVGDPAAGTGEAYTVTGSEIYVAAAIGFAVPNIEEQVTARFATADWQYTPPIGFDNEWPNAAPGAYAPDPGALAFTGLVPVAYVEPNDGTEETPLSLTIQGVGEVEKLLTAEAGFLLDIQALGDVFFSAGGAEFSLDIQAVGGAPGLITGEGVLPAITSTGILFTGTIGTGTVVLPAVTSTGSSPGEGTNTFPAIVISAEGVIGSLGTAALQLPPVRVSVSGDVANLISGAASLPAVRGLGSGVTGSFGSAALVLGALRGTGTGALVPDGAGVVVFPAVQGLGTGFAGNVATGAIVLPAVLIDASMAHVAFTDEWVTLNTEVLAHTRYTDVTFTAFVELNGKVYGASPSGLYLLEGDDDDGTAIAAEFRLGMDDFGSDFLKGNANVYVGGFTDGTLKLFVGVDGGASYTYTMDRDLFTSGDRNIRAPVGRGLRSRYWQLGIQNTLGADFAIDSMGGTLRNLKRKS